MFARVGSLFRKDLSARSEHHHFRPLRRKSLTDARKTTRQPSMMDGPNYVNKEAKFSIIVSADKSEIQIRASE